MEAEEKMVVKGFADFVNLRNLFVKKFPHAKIPTLPNVTLFVNFFPLLFYSEKQLVKLGRSETARSEKRSNGVFIAHF